MEKSNAIGGVNESERYVGRLCQKTFLTMWSHQNLFTDRGTSEKNRNGKELCDLLVIFENHIIIFSEKQCDFPNTGNVVTDWSRWCKKAVLKCADQIFGAERWIKEFPNRIYKDNLCKIPFPHTIPSTDEVEFHRVAISLGAGERTKSHFGGRGSGSLIINSSIKGNDHLNLREGQLPFSVGHIAKEKGFVHVFDDYSLEIVLSELDTISDFVEYLKVKEKFVCASDYILWQILI